MHTLKWTLTFYIFTVVLKRTTYPNPYQCPSHRLCYSINMSLSLWSQQISVGVSRINYYDRSIALICCSRTRIVLLWLILSIYWLTHLACEHPLGFCFHNPAAQQSSACTCGTQAEVYIKAAFSQAWQHHFWHNSHHFWTSLTEGWLSSLSGKRLTSFMVLASRTGSSFRRNM